ncbi:MAG: M48 family metallopeptidase [Lachnospiraceae bacterium]
MKRQYPNTYIYNLHISPKDVLPCTVHFSDRKSIGIQIKEDASVHVRAPYYARQREVEAFIEEKKDWIIKNYQKMLARTRISTDTLLSPIQEQQVTILQKRFYNAARSYFPRRCAELQKLTGGHYTKITIRNQKTRWGSCSQTGTLSFNYRLMMAPPAVIDYVIVHELCHLTHMNHSKAFWNKVANVMPDYKIRKQWLKEHGAELTEAHYLLSLM